MSPTFTDPDKGKIGIAPEPISRKITFVVET
jgi:hypothetical protein